MPRAEVGTPKYIANKMKSKGLQKLRWYCQVCEKQCRDENGFKCHIASESHLRQMLVVGEHAGKHIADYSMQFQSEFVKLLSRRFGTKRVKANTVYQEYIQDKQHLHMNSTRWVTLTGFVQYLGRAGIAHVDETEKGWFIQWIDRSPKALAKQASAQMKERSTMSDEQRERLMIAEQIEKAEMEKGSDDEADDEVGMKREEGLKREEGIEKVVLTFKNKGKEKGGSEEAEVSGSGSGSGPGSGGEEGQAETSTAPALSISTPTPSSSSAPAPPTMKIGFNAFKSNPLKPTGVNPLKTNVFKASASAKAGSSSSSSEGKRKEPMSMAEQVILEDQQRKRRKMEREGMSMRV